MGSNPSPSPEEEEEFEPLASGRRDEAQPSRRLQFNPTMVTPRSGCTWQATHRRKRVGENALTDAKPSQAAPCNHPG